MNLVHPLALMAYSVAILCFLCLLSSRSTTTAYQPARCIRYCMDQAKHSLQAQQNANPVLQLNRYASALSYVAAARSLAPDNATIVKLTRIDPSELAAAIQRAARPLLKRGGIHADHFQAMIAA